MTPKYKVEFGEPKEREKFIVEHERFFERIGSLVKALNIAAIKVNANLSNAEVVIDTLCKLCVENFNEILLLSANGFGNGAITLLRSMFEKLVTARYLELHPNEVDKFFDYHAVKLHKLRQDNALKEFDPDGSILNQFKVVRKKGGRKRLQSSWTNNDLVKMAEEVGLGEFVKWAYHVPLEFAHPSVTAIVSFLEETDGQLTIKENEPRPQLAEDALMLAQAFLLEILRLQVAHYKVKDNPLFQQCIDDYAYIWGKERRSSDESLK